MFRISPAVILPYPVCAFFVAALACSALAQEKQGFDREILPILRKHCLECHGPDDQQSGLRLDQRSSMLRGGDTGRPTIVPGSPKDSFLLLALSGSNEHEIKMPPEGEALSVDELEALRQWIEQGADWPGQMDATATDVQSDLWSLKPLLPSAPTQELSQSIDDWIELELSKHGLAMSPRADPVTLLRRASLVLTGLPPTRQEIAEFVAHPAGLEAAYAAAIDRLLASERYGERWAQHWLDTIRWAETVGFETNAERPNAWPYRDWVIAAFNTDKTYDRFLYEQLAGDTVGEDAALGFLVAGPANLPGQIGRDEEAMRQARQDELDEVINTVSQAALGLTVGCARCHNHKFDPILQRDYYAMQAIFAGLNYGDRRLRGELDDRWTQEIPAAQEKLDEKIEQAAALRKHFKLDPELSDLQTETFAPVAARAVRMEIAATGSRAPASLYEFQVWTHSATDQEAAEGPRNVALAVNGATPSASSFALANQTRHYDNLVDGSSDRRQAFPWDAKEKGAAWLQVDLPRSEWIERIVWDRGSSVPAEYTIKVLTTDAAGQDVWQTVADTANRWLREDDTRAADAIHLQELSMEDISRITQVNAELRSIRADLRRLTSGPQVFAAEFNQPPEPTWLLNRGDPMNRREAVLPAIPVVLGRLDVAPDAEERICRIAFARHVTRTEHPLTARVMVNRIWQYHFGEGLVDTPSDFGEMGSRPTHPELLDQLATEFMRGGWSMKNLHRQIVLSRTFQQSNQPQTAALAIDADSRLLWRFPPRRLEAEAIRDSILQVSGKLNLQVGGPGFSLFKQRGGLADYAPIETFDENGWRRMIYAHKVRMQAVDIFGAFDCPDSGQMQPKRTRSTTPSQSLSLFNSPFVLKQASYFAQRLREEVGDDPHHQVQRAFEISVSRLPSVNEENRMVELVKQAGLDQLCRVLINSSEFLFLP